MRTKFKTLLKLTLMALCAIGSLILLCTSGCSTTKVIFPDGTEILHQPLFLKTSADVVDFFFERSEPNGLNYTLWIILNDPNRSVNPGTLKIEEPYTKINATLTAGESK